MFDFLRFHIPRSRPETAVVIDLGTSAAKAAVVDLTTFNPTLVGLGKETYPEGAILSGLVANWEQFVSTVAGALRQASLPGGFTPSEVVYSLSGEFIKTVSVELSIHRPRSGPLIQGEEREIEKEINRLIRLEITKEYQRITGASSGDVKVVEKNLLGLASPKGVMLESLRSILESDFRASFLVSFISGQTEKLLRRLTADLKKNWSGTVDQMTAVVLSLKDQEPNISAVFLDLGGQVTDLAVVFQGKIVGERTLPLGGRDMESTVEPGAKVSFEQFFCRALERALVDILGERELPAWTLYYFGGLAHSPWWKDLFSNFLEKNPQSVLRSLTPQMLEVSSFKNLPLVTPERILDFEPFLVTAARLSQKYAAP